MDHGGAKLPQGPRGRVSQQRVGRLAQHGVWGAQAARLPQHMACAGRASRSVGPTRTSQEHESRPSQQHQSPSSPPVACGGQRRLSQQLAARLLP
jgi:hypothetical protein